MIGYGVRFHPLGADMKVMNLKRVKKRAHVVGCSVVWLLWGKQGSYDGPKRWMSVQLPPASVSSPQVLASLPTALVLNIVIIFFVVDDRNKAQGYIYLTLLLLLSESECLSLPSSYLLWQSHVPCLMCLVQPPVWRIVICISCVPRVFALPSSPSCVLMWSVVVHSLSGRL